MENEDELPEEVDEDEVQSIVDEAKRAIRDASDDDGNIDEDKLKDELGMG